MKKLGLSYPVKGLMLFPPSNHSAPGCHQHTTCPHGVTPDRPQHKDPLAFTAQITHVPFRELMTRSSLQQFKSPDSCTQMGMSVRRDKTRVRWSPQTKHLPAKTELLYAPLIHKANTHLELQHWQYTQTVCNIRETTTPSLPQKDFIQLHPTQRKC